MEINHLRYFYEVAKAGSFTAASKSLRVSQPALSKTVAMLEDHEGVKLLNRGKKGVTLTPMGEMVYLKCETIFRDLADLSDQMQGRRAICAGPLRIGTSDHLANYVLPTPLLSFHQKYPGVHPNLYVGTPTEIVSRILERDLEFGLFFTRIDAPGMEYQEIGTIEFVAVSHPKLMKGLPSSPTLRKKFLGSMGFIGSRTRDYRKSHPAHDLLETLGAEQGLLFETNSQEMQKRLSLAGYGYAVLPRFMVEIELKKKELVEISASRRMSVPVLLAKRKHHAFSLPAQKFSELLMERLS